jgi:hypothetical protein
VGAGTKWAANLWIWNRVRLGYTRAPRKVGAAAYDPAAGIGRDRMAKKAAAVAAPAQPTVVFVNRDDPGARLFYNEDTFMGALVPGAPGLRFNSYEGHQWTVKDAAGKILGKYTVDARPEQEFSVGKSSSQALHNRPSSAPKLPPGARPPN